MQVLTESGQQPDIRSQEAQIMRDISSDTAGAHHNLARIGVLRNQLGKRNAANIHVDAAHNNGISARAQDISLTHNMSFFHQIRHMHGCGRTCNPQLISQLLLRDHGIFRDALQHLSFSLSHFPHL